MARWLEFDEERQEQPQEVVDLSELAKSLGITRLILPGQALDTGTPNLSYGGADLIKSVGAQGPAGSWASAPTDLSGIKLGDNPIAGAVHSGIALVRIGALPGDSATIVCNSDYQSAVTCWQFRIGSSGQIQICKPGVAVIVNGSTAGAVGEWVVLGWSEDTADHRVYRAGVLDGSDTTSYSYSTSAQASIGACYGNSVYDWRGQIAALAIAPGRLWTSAQHALWRNPADVWALFAPRPTWVPVSSGGAAFKPAWARNRSQVIGAGVH